MSNTPPDKKPEKTESIKKEFSVFDLLFRRLDKRMRDIEALPTFGNGYKEYEKQKQNENNNLQNYGK